MKIQPCTSFSGEFEIPGDKSITHRAVMFNAAARGEAIVTNALMGEDCLSTVSCMRALGADVRTEDNKICVRGTLKFKAADLYCGNSGTTMRLLMGLIAGRSVHARLTGDPSLSRRPMERVAAPLRLLGADIRTSDGTAPVEISAAPLVGAAVDTKVASAQVKSAVLLAALGARGKTIVREPLKTRDHTERMLAAMGADVRVNGAEISSAAYFMALGALRGETLCKNVGINPTRTGILEAFSRMNVRFVLENERTVCGEPVADIRVYRSELKAIELTREIMPSLIDELPLIALLCAFAEGESRISGAEELKVKESDRIRTTAAMIGALGGDCTPTDDGFVIRGRESLRGGTVESAGDHRIAMSGAVGLAASDRGGEIFGAECADISFPNFYKMLSSHFFF